MDNIRMKSKIKAPILIYYIIDSVSGGNEKR